MVDDSYQYNEWLESDEFVEYVNRELIKQGKIL